MASPQTTYVQQTNTTTPDPTTQAWRDSVSGSLIDQAGRVPEVYGSTWIPREAKMPDGSPHPMAGRYIANSNPLASGWRSPGAVDQPLTAGSNADIDAAGRSVRGINVSPLLQQAGLGYNAAAATDIAGAGNRNFGQAEGSYGQAAGSFGSAGDTYGAAGSAYGQAGGFFDRAAAGKSGAAGQEQFNAATGRFERAGDVDTTAQFQPYGAQAQSLYGASTNPTGLAAASPYLQAASGSFPQQAAAYMNPYNEGVTNRIAQLGARNLSENLLPQISDDFVRAGGYGSTRQRDLIGRAVRDTNESVLGQQAQVLQQGYGQAGQLYGADAARQAQLAGTAGGLGTSQQQILQGAGSGLGSLGSTYAGLSANDAARQIAAAQGLSSIGQSNIQASQADLARVLAAGQGQVGIGQGLTSLGQAQLDQGQGYAGLGQNYAGLGQARVGSAAAGAAGQIAAGTANQGLATTTQDLALGQANAQQNVGIGQQSRTQAEIDAEQRRLATGNTAIINQVGASGNALMSGGQGGGTTTGAGTTTAPGPSTLGQVAGAAGSIIAGANLLGRAKGGPIRKGSLKKARYGDTPKRGLGMFERVA